MKLPEYRKEILDKKVEELREKYGEININSLQRIGSDYGFDEFIHVPFLRMWGAVGEDNESKQVILYSGVLPFAKKLDLVSQLAPAILREEQKYQNQKEQEAEIKYFIKKLLETNTITLRTLSTLDEIPSLAVYMSYPLIKAALILPFGIKGIKEKFKSKENRIKELGLECLINEEVMQE